MKNLEKQIKSLLKENKLLELEELLSNYSEAEIRDPLLSVSFDTEHTAIYSVVCMMLLKKPAAEMHYLAAEILVHSLHHLEGAYFTAVYHIRKAIKLDPKDPGLKEFLIFLHGIPDMVVSKEEAISLAKALIKENPENQCANNFLERYKIKSIDQS
jgi:hypothetical protein